MFTKSFFFFLIIRLDVLAGSKAGRTTTVSWVYVAALLKLQIVNRQEQDVVVMVGAVLIVICNTGWMTSRYRHWTSSNLIQPESLREVDISFACRIKTMASCSTNQQS